MNTKIVVDSVDRNSGIARIEIDGNFIEIPSILVPKECLGGEILKFIVDSDSTNNSKNTVKELENKLFKRKNNN